jgi:hypothetical protein
VGRRHRTLTTTVPPLPNSNTRLRRPGRRGRHRGWHARKTYEQHPLRLPRSFLDPRTTGSSNRAMGYSKIPAFQTGNAVTEPRRPALLRNRNPRPRPQLTAKLRPAALTTAAPYQVSSCGYPSNERSGPIAPGVGPRRAEAPTQTSLDPALGSTPPPSTCRFRLRSPPMVVTSAGVSPRESSCSMLEISLRLRRPAARDIGRDGCAPGAAQRTRDP